MMLQKTIDSTQPLFSMESIQHIFIPQFKNNQDTLTVFSSPETIPFTIQRLFTVTISKACVRGQHAHKECTQLMILLQGSCTVVCDDGIEKQSFNLIPQSQGLLVPPTIWAEQQYGDDSLLLVITDQLYNPDDYIRNYEQFLQWRGIP